MYVAPSLTNAKWPYNCKIEYSTDNDLPFPPFCSVCGLFTKADQLFEDCERNLSFDRNRHSKVSFCSCETHIWVTPSGLLSLWKYDQKLYFSKTFKALLSQFYKKQKSIVISSGQTVISIYFTLWRKTPRVQVSILLLLKWGKKIRVERSHTINLSQLIRTTDFCLNNEME